MATPHNTAAPGDIAKTVLMPGDPLRAKFIAEHFLENAVCYNEVRGMYGYTGTYHGVRISVQGSGMGMPSMGIYSYELYHEYQVERILRIGTAGAVADHVRLRDIVLGQAACTDSNYAAQYGLSGTFAPIASYALLTLMTAQVCGLQPGEFVHTLGDTHLYLNHLEQVDEQLAREPRPLPVMRLNPSVKSLFDFRYGDFTLEGYDPWPAIKAPMSF